MSTSGTIGGASHAHVKASSQQIAVRLLNLPDSLQSNRQTLRIEGQIVSSGPDKTLLLKTGYGDVTVQARGGFRAQEGQRVQIDVPPGQAPKNSVLRSSSSTEAIAIKTDNPSLAKTVAEQGVSLSRKADISATNLTNAQSAQISAKPEISIKASPLIEGGIVRLAPVSGGAQTPIQQTISTQLQQVQAQFLQNLSGKGSFSILPSSFQGQPAQIVNGGQAYSSSLSQLVVGGNQATPQTQQGNVSVFSSGYSGNVQGGGTQGVYASQAFSFPPLSRFDAQFISQSVSPISSSGQASALLLNGQATSISFQVIGFTGNQQAVIQPLYATHPSGFSPPNAPTFVIQQPVNNLQIGSVLQFSPIGGAIAQNGGANIVPIDQFTSLMIAIKELQVSNPAMAQALSALAPTATAVPQRAGAEILFLLSALKGGGIDQWTGQTDSASSRRQLLQILEQTLKEGVTPKLVQNTPTGDWRAYSFPMQAQDNTAVPVSLYVQDHYQPSQDDQSADEEEIKITRFLFEFDLTRMGEIQVDGLMREKNVDIFIRTTRELGADMKKAVRGVYLNALERSDLTGDVAFQNDPKRWVNVSPK